MQFVLYMLIWRTMTWNKNELLSHVFWCDEYFFKADISCVYVTGCSQWNKIDLTGTELGWVLDARCVVICPRTMLEAVGTDAFSKREATWNEHGDPRRKRGEKPTKERSLRGSCSGSSEEENEDGLVPREEVVLGLGRRPQPVSAALLFLVASGPPRYRVCSSPGRLWLSWSPAVSLRFCW